MKHIRNYKNVTKNVTVQLLTSTLSLDLSDLLNLFSGLPNHVRRDESESFYNDKQTANSRFRTQERIGEEKSWL